MQSRTTKFAPVLLLFLLGGCASTASPGALGVIRFERVTLKNPATGKYYACVMRLTTQGAAESRPALEANQRACVRNGQAAGYTHMVQLARWP